EIDQQYRLVERTERKEERHEAERQERAFRAWFDAIEMMATGAMLADGYHQHHGQWRRKRHGDERPGGAPAPGGGGGSTPGEADVGRVQGPRRAGGEGGPEEPPSPP